MPVVGSWSGNLSDTDDQIVLMSGGAIVLDFTYKDDWYPSTDGTGPSLSVANEHAHPLFWDDKEGWRPSGETGGTPGSPEDACAAWSWEHFDAEEFADPEIGGIDADPDGDGLTNGLEFALALDPRSPQAEASPDLVEIDGEFYLTLTFEHDRRATFLSSEVSDDLSWWSSSPADLETYIREDLGSDIERVTIRDLTPIDFSSPRRFIRLSVQK